jgi:hypothetical protein
VISVEEVAQQLEEPSVSDPDQLEDPVLREADIASPGVEIQSRTTLIGHILSTCHAITDQVSENVPVITHPEDEELCGEYHNLLLATIAMSLEHKAALLKVSSERPSTPTGLDITTPRSQPDNTSVTLPPPAVMVDCSEASLTLDNDRLAYQRLRDEIEDVVLNLDAMRALAKELKAEKAGLEAEKAGLEATAKDRAKEMEEITHEVGVLRNNAEEMKRQSHRSGRIAVAAEEARRKMEQSVVTLQARLKELGDKESRTTFALLASQREQKKHHSRMQSLSDELHYWRMDHVKMERMFKQLQDAYLQLEKEEKERTESLRMAEATLVQYTADISRLKQLYESTKKQRDDQEVSMRKKLDKKNSQLATLESRCSALESDVQAERAKYQEAQAKLASWPRPRMGSTRDARWHEDNQRKQMANGSRPHRRNQAEPTQETMAHNERVRAPRMLDGLALPDPVEFPESYQFCPVRGLMVPSEDASRGRHTSYPTGPERPYWW